MIRLETQRIQLVQEARSRDFWAVSWGAAQTMRTSTDMSARQGIATQVNKAKEMTPTILMYSNGFDP
eukprot:2631075-Amphidinium_carterae.2